MIKKHKRGFSLIELIVVMAVMAILVLIATPKYLSYTTEARQKQIVADIKVVGDKVSTYLIKHSFPEEDRIEVDLLREHIALNKLYDLKGLVTSFDEADTYTILPAKLVKSEAGSKLNGQFISSSGGDVYYIDTRPGKSDSKESEHTDTLTIKLTQGENLNQMLANITYPLNSIIREYKIDDNDWISVDITNASSKYMSFMTVNAVNEATVKINIPYGSTVFARCTTSTNNTYESKSELFIPIINYTIKEGSSGTTVDISFPSNATLKECRIDNGSWAIYNDSLSLNKGAVVYARAFGVDGSLIAYGSETIPDNNPIAWSGADAAAFDRDIKTGVTLKSAKICWTGNLVDRVIVATLGSLWSSTSIDFTVKDMNGKSLNFYDTSGNLMSNYYGQVPKTISFVCPENAAYILISGSFNDPVIIYDIREAVDIIPTLPVSNLKATPLQTIVNLSWQNPSDEDFKTVWVYRNGVRIGMSNNGTYTDSALSSDTTYTYELRAVDQTGNLSSPISVVTTTLTREISWSGAGEAAFDRSFTTSLTVYEATIRWTGDLADKVIVADFGPYQYQVEFTVKDKDGKALSFYETSGNRISSYTGARKKITFVCPENAAYIHIRSIYNTKVILYDIHETEDLIPTSPVDNLTANPSKTTVELSWQNPSDEDFKTVWVYRNGIKIGASTTGSYIDKSLLANTEYSYEVRAVDNIGNLSSPSILKVTTLVN